MDSKSNETVKKSVWELNRKMSKNNNKSVFKQTQGRKPVRESGICIKAEVLINSFVHCSLQGTPTTAEDLQKLKQL